MEDYIEIHKRARLGGHQGVKHLLYLAKVTMPATQNYIAATAFNARRFVCCGYALLADNTVVAAAVSPDQKKVLFFGSDGTSTTVDEDTVLYIYVRLEDPTNIGSLEIEDIGTGEGEGSGSGSGSGS